MKIPIPAFLLMDKTGEPFVLPGETGDIWPLFRDRDNALAFAVGVQRIDLLVYEVVSAVNLLDLMTDARPTILQNIWMNEEIAASNAVQFRDRPPAADFFAALEDRAQQERKADLN